MHYRFATQISPKTVNILRITFNYNDGERGRTEPIFRNEIKNKCNMVLQTCQKTGKNLCSIKPITSKLVF